MGDVDHVLDVDSRRSQLEPWVLGGETEMEGPLGNSWWRDTKLRVKRCWKEILI